MRGTLAAAACIAIGFTGSTLAAEAGTPRHRHHYSRKHVIETEPPLVPRGYAYGGYGDGPGPGWSDPTYGPAGYGPGYGYIPPGYSDAGFDLGR